VSGKRYVVSYGEDGSQSMYVCPRECVVGYGMGSRVDGSITPNVVENTIRFDADDDTWRIILDSGDDVWIFGRSDTESSRFF
jgi:hypothetical protein